MLKSSLCLVYLSINSKQGLMQHIDSVHVDSFRSLTLSVILTKFDSLIPLFKCVIKGANVKLVASLLVTHDSLIFIGMVETLHCRVTFTTFETT